MNLPIFKEFDPDEYRITNWKGRWFGRYLQVTSRLSETPELWGVHCYKCKVDFALSPAQLENPRTVLCGCR
jgi:hypothetical protein